MAYCFKLREPPQAGLRRIASEQASRIVKHLSTDTGEEATIHESRKALKRLKALFKLVRRGLDKNDYSREYGVIHGVGRRLSGARDLEVMPATLATLAAALAARDCEIDDASLRQVRSAIDEARSEHAADTERPALLSSAAAEIKAASTRYKKLRLRAGLDDYAMLTAGVAHGLQTLHRQHDIAVSTGYDEDYHDWRKGAQLHWRHLRLLAQAWPELMHARMEVAKALAQVLGEDHDLTVFATFVEGLPSSRLKRTRRKELVARIRARQLELRAQARAYAGPLVIDKPKQFAARLDAYHAARSEIHNLGLPSLDAFVLHLLE